MLRGLYTAGWGMMSRNKNMDVVSNNLANVDTNGFKRDDFIFESFPEVLVGRINDGRGQINPTRIVGDASLGADVGEVFTNHEMGGFKSTQRSLDMAIEGQNGAFFTIDVDGEEHFTRNGAFSLNQDGFLVTMNGDLVLGEDGPIQIESDDFIVSSNGEIRVDDELIDTLLIQGFDDTRDLIKRGENLFAVNPEVEDPVLIEEDDATWSIRQGFIETSNVNIIKEMVNMVEVARAYESNQKVVHSMDEIIQKAVNEVGRV